MTHGTSANSSQHVDILVFEKVGLQFFRKKMNSSFSETSIRPSAEQSKYSLPTPMRSFLKPHLFGFMLEQ